MAGVFNLDCSKNDQKEELDKVRHTLTSICIAVSIAAP
jgi:hypothetical protein